MKKVVLIMLSIMIMLGASGCGGKTHTAAKPAVTPVKTETAAPSPTANVSKNTEEIYIGNRRSKKFHKSDCHTLPKEKNRIEFSSRDSAVKKGYSPCGNCNP